MRLFHQHQWKIESTHFTEPVHLYLPDYRRAIEGTTHIYYRCESCGEVREDSVFGKYTPPTGRKVVSPDQVVTELFVSSSVIDTNMPIHVSVRCACPPGTDAPGLAGFDMNLSISLSKELTRLLEAHIKIAEAAAPLKQ
jgi:hypothetical protein